MANILIVEDEAIIALMLKKHLAKLGHTIVAVVKTGSDAIEKARALSPDIILMDVKIVGDLNGISAVMEIRKFSETPIIFTSGNGTDPLYELKSFTNIQALTKPIAFADLDLALANSLKLAPL